MKRTVALALTWDGARWPARKLPVKARAFLRSAKAQAAPIVTSAAKLFADDQIKELRICWVPQLAGGEDVLTAPFPAPKGKRLGFRTVRTVALGQMLGVVYKR